MGWVDIVTLTIGVPVGAWGVWVLCGAFAAQFNRAFGEDDES